MDDLAYSQRPRVFGSCGDLDNRRILKSRSHFRWHLTTAATADYPPQFPRGSVSLPSAAGRPAPAPGPAAPPIGRMTRPEERPAFPRIVRKSETRHLDWFE